MFAFGRLGLLLNYVESGESDNVERFCQENKALIEYTHDTYSHAILYMQGMISLSLPSLALDSTIDNTASFPSKGL